MCVCDGILNNHVGQVQLNICICKLLSKHNTKKSAKNQIKQDDEVSAKKEVDTSGRTDRLIKTNYFFWDLVSFFLLN